LCFPFYPFGFFFVSLVVTCIFFFILLELLARFSFLLLLFLMLLSFLRVLFVLLFDFFGLTFFLFLVILLSLPPLSNPTWIDSGNGTCRFRGMILGVEGCEIAVRLIPRARVNEIAGERNGVLLARVTAPPVDGRANAALCRLIAKRVGIGVRSVSIVRGASAREKVVRVEGIGEEELRRALG